MTTSASVSQLTAATNDLRRTMRGSVLTKSDPQYDAARRIWNGAVVRHPAIIARCASAQDVATSVRVAREYDIPLSVRGGGHDWAGRALRDSGLVLDLSAMRDVAIEADGHAAVARGGATAGAVAVAADRIGRAPVTGNFKSVGMAGLTLGGGYGPLNGKHGLALDNLISAQVVLADGRPVTANHNENTDLYWALRGGGGNFGVVTAARYRLHPLDSVVSGLILFPLDQATAVLRAYLRIIPDAPDELTVQFGFITGPGGQPALFLFPTWSGERTEGEEFLDALTHLGKPVVAEINAMPYVSALEIFESHVVNGRHYALRTRSITEIDEDAISLLVRGARNATSAFSAIAVHHFHGAASRVPVEQTAFALRRDHFAVEIIAAWEPSDIDDGRAHVRWAESISAELAAFALPGGYPNILGPGESDRVRLAYGPNADRLRQIKRRFDPDGVFTHATGSFY
jgi:FAD/FMN-containing dehydrogenase